MRFPLSRREMIARAGACLAATGLASAASEAEKDTSPNDPSPAEPFRYCLNTGTIRGQNLSLADEVDVAARAGYRGIEPWISKIREYAAGGGSLTDMKKRIADRGLAVESAIGFARWIYDTPVEQKAGLEEFRRDVELVAAIGGLRIAAPPVGVTGQEDRDLAKIARCYRAVLEMGREMGVVPQLELWGPSKTLCRLGEVAYVTVEAAHPDACSVLDVYHIYKGGSDFAGLAAMNGRRMHVFHMNDYPSDPPRETINDSHRVMPGDGVAPLGSILRDLRAIGFRGVLSLELFNQDYWKLDALEVAKTGLGKMRRVVESALADTG
ncbi:MAG: sugar phosphate isomerase/epimerase [Planctomycetia bacterium]|nr:sugar phosphate isomerase/epimerase [Planctomycetia bacterium]